MGLGVLRIIFSDSCTIGPQPVSIGIKRHTPEKVALIILSIGPIHMMLLLFKAQIERLLLLNLLLYHSPHGLLLRHLSIASCSPNSPGKPIGHNDLSVLAFLDQGHSGDLIVALVGECPRIGQFVSLEVLARDTFEHSFEGLGVKFYLVPGPGGRRVVLVCGEALKLMDCLNALPREH